MDAGLGVSAKGRSGMTHTSPSVSVSSPSNIEFDFFFFFSSLSNLTPPRALCYVEPRRIVTTPNSFSYILC